MRTSRTRRVALGAFAAVALLATACGDDAGGQGSAGGEADTLDTLRVIAVSEGPDANLREAMAPLNDAFGEATGLEIELVEVADGNSMVEALAADRADVATLSGFLMTFARQLADVEVVAGASGSEDVSVFAVRQDSDIQSIEDLRGTTVALGAEASAGSNWQPREELRAAGLEAGTDVEVTNTGGYDAALLALQNGSVDAAASRPMIMEQLSENGQTDADAFRIIHRSDPLPLALSVVVRSELPEQVRADLQEYFLGEDGLETLGQLFPLLDETFVPDEEVFGYFEGIIDDLGVELSEVE